MTVQQLIEALQAQGWRLVAAEENCHRLHHDALRRSITISGQLPLSVPQSLLRQIKRYAELGE